MASNGVTLKRPILPVPGRQRRFVTPARAPRIQPAGDTGQKPSSRPGGVRYRRWHNDHQAGQRHQTGQRADLADDLPASEPGRDVEVGISGSPSPGLRPASRRSMTRGKTLHSPRLRLPADQPCRDRRLQGWLAGRPPGGLLAAGLGNVRRADPQDPVEPDGDDRGSAGLCPVFQPDAGTHRGGLPAQNGTWVLPRS